MSIEAMKQALEALFKTLKILADANERGVITDTLWFSEYETLFDYLESEITSLRQAIAEAETQEPVAVVDSTISGDIDWLCVVFPKQGTKLYTHPQPKREPPTPRKVKDTLRATGLLTNSQAWDVAEEVMKLLADHGIKE
jgi:hypothetical protein